MTRATGMVHPKRLAAGLLAFAVVAGSSGCLFHRKKAKASAPAYPPSPVRIALLPPNIPSDDAETRWVSLATVALLAKEAESAHDLELVPVWQALPVAIEALGGSRTLTDEIAAYVASRVGAKWATEGELKPGKDGVSLLLDFIPAKSSAVAYRYRKETRVDGLSSNLREALDQFLRYLIARPLPGKDRGKLAIDAGQLKEIAAALDREYGWFASAEPGKADKAFAGVARSDDKLARLLFNPALYQTPATQPAAPSRQGVSVPPPEP